MEKNKSIILKLIYIISIFCLGYFTYTIFKNNILPQNLRLIGFGVLGVIYLSFSFIVFRKRKINTIIRILLAILFIAFSYVFLLASQYIDKGISTVNTLNESHGKEKLEYSLIVLKDSSLSTIDDLKDKEIATALERDKENIESYIEDKDEIKSLKLANGGDYASIVKNLLEKNIEVIFFDESYRSMIDEIFPNFGNDTKIIKKLEIEKEIISETQVEKDENDTQNSTEETDNSQERFVGSKDSFNLYISGIDTYGGISTKGRSDVNLIVSVNPNTRNITITTIPRDSYVKIAGGGNNQYDKLTHSGIYGINSSIKTLENLFKINIDYYARVNFSSLIKVVDAMGGIDVYSDQAFTPRHGKISIKKGMNHLNGKEALSFARERKSLNNGDMDRGRNHMRVVEAIINKALKPSILLNYNSVLDSILGSSQTNFSYDKIINLINNQISNGGSWTINKQDISGKSERGLPSYAMPGWNLYMFVPSSSSIENAKNNIRENNQ